MASPSSPRLLVELAPHSVQLLSVDTAGKLAGYVECATEPAAVTAALAQLGGGASSGQVQALVIPASSFVLRANADEAASTRTAESLLARAKTAAQADTASFKTVAFDGATGAKVDATGTTPWVISGATVEQLDAAKARLNSLGLSSPIVSLAFPTQIGAVTMALKNLPESTRVLIWQIGADDAQLAYISPAGCEAVTTVPLGFGAIADAVQAHLGLRFRAAATKLFFNADYDFTDAAGPIADRLVALLQPAIAALGCTPTALHMVGLPAAQAWLAKALASALKINLLLTDIPAFCTQRGLTGPAIKSSLPIAALGLLLRASHRGPGEAPWLPAWLDVNTPTRIPPTTAPNAAVKPAAATPALTAAKSTPPPAKPVTKAKPASTPATQPTAPKTEAPASLPDNAPAAEPSISPKKKPVVLVAIVAAAVVFGGLVAWLLPRGGNGNGAKVTSPVSVAPAKAQVAPVASSPTQNADNSDMASALKKLAFGQDPQSASDYCHPTGAVITANTSKTLISQTFDPDAAATALDGTALSTNNVGASTWKSDAGISANGAINFVSTTKPKAGSAYVDLGTDSIVKPGGGIFELEITLNKTSTGTELFTGGFWEIAHTNVSHDTPGAGSAWWLWRAGSNELIASTGKGYSGDIVTSTIAKPHRIIAAGYETFTLQLNLTNPTLPNDTVCLYKGDSISGARLGNGATPFSGDEGFRYVGFGVRALAANQTAMANVKSLTLRQIVIPAAYRQGKTTQDYFAITYRENVSATDINYRVEQSNDAMNWTPLTPGAGEIIKTPITGTNFCSVEARVPLSASTQYLRVMATRGTTTVNAIVSRKNDTVNTSNLPPKQLPTVTRRNSSAKLMLAINTGYRDPIIITTDLGKIQIQSVVIETTSQPWKDLQPKTTPTPSQGTNLTRTATYVFSDGTELTYNVNAKVAETDVIVKGSWQTPKSVKGFARVSLWVTQDISNDLTIEEGGKPVFSGSNKQLRLTKLGQFTFRKKSTGEFLFKVTGDYVGALMFFTDKHPEWGVSLELDNVPNLSEATISAPMETNWKLSFTE